MNCIQDILKVIPIYIAAISAVITMSCGGVSSGKPPTPVSVPTITQPPLLPLKLAEIVTPTPLPPSPTPTPRIQTDAKPIATTPGYKSETNMYRFFSRPNHPVKVALDGLDRAMSNKDVSQVPIILEVMRFFPSEKFQQAVQETLKLLTGQPPETEEWEWDRWMTWLWKNSAKYKVPDGYLTWKSLLLKGIDGRYGEFLSPDTKISQDLLLTELIWGGIPPDQTPPLVDPEVVTVAEADYMLPGDRVFGISINGEQRAYPLRITNTHEIVNDTLGGQPIVLTQCVLCGSGVAYSSSVGGKRTNFGTSGLIYRSNTVVYDLNNKTLWLQFSGIPIVGSATSFANELPRIPVVVTTWKEWTSLHPNTTVLSILNDIFPPSAYAPEDTPGSPLEIYLAQDETIFPVWLVSDALGPKEPILGIRLPEVEKAYPVRILQKLLVVNDQLGETNIAIIASPKTEAARVYNRGQIKLSLLEGNSSEAVPYQVIDEDGGIWEVTEEALISIDDPDRKLPRVPSQIALWFAWHAFYPNTTLYEDN